MSESKGKKSKVSSQSARFLEAAKAAGVDESGRKFRQAMGKITLARNARKPTRMG